MTFRHPNGLPGRGPWRILADCPSPLHNTQNSSLGRHSGGQKCICPRALDLKAKRHKELKEYEGRRPRGRPRDGISQHARFLYMTPASTIQEMPKEMRAAACATEEGMPYADDGMDQHMTPAGVRRREQAKNFCLLACPVVDECLKYIRANESPAGSWGGVWGGLDPWERAGKKLVVVHGKVKVFDYEPAGAA